MSLRNSMDEFGSGDSLSYRAWLGLTLFVAPVGVAIVFAEATGLRALVLGIFAEFMVRLFG